MPQHRVGGYVRSLKWLTVITVAVALTVGLLQPGQAVPAAIAGTIGDGSAQLSLPWTLGTTWRLTGGPHHYRGARARPWSSLDFQPVDGKAGGKVLAARGGYASRPCANLVVLRHDGGWSTSYYHLREIAVSNGDWVARGQLLGYTSSAAGCGGSATGPHVHFSLMRDKSFVNIGGHTIGGWTVREGSTQYKGCLVKGDERRCAPGGLIHNDGSVGVR